jgi:hypothetical protein
MSEAAATTPPPPAAAAGPVGKPRGIAFVIIISIITLGIYFLYWLYKTGEETKKYSGDGLGGVLWLVIGLLIGIVMWFVAPSEVGKLYSARASTSPSAA